MINDIPASSDDVIFLDDQEKENEELQKKHNFTENSDNLVDL